MFNTRNLICSLFLGAVVVAVMPAMADPAMITFAYTKDELEGMGINTAGIGTVEGNASINKQWDDRAEAKRKIGSALEELEHKASRGDASALQQLEDIANGGDVKAQAYLGMIYNNGGQGVPQNYATAMQWYQKAAEQGDRYVQSWMGKVYADGGMGVPQDYVQAIKWYIIAEANSSSRVFYGMFYEVQQLENLVAPAQIVQAQKLADVWLAAHHRVNDRVNDNRTIGSALDKLERKALNGDASALQQLESTANSGDVKAQLFLMYAYNGVGAVPRNHTIKAQWTEKAASQGDSYAQSEMGAWYTYGLGVPKDHVQAMQWLIIAKSNGDSYSDYEIVYPPLPPAQITEAQELAGKWLAAHHRVK